jgi:multidrug resistance efflux pump
LSSSQGQLLATLDDRDLLVERQRWLSEREQHEGRYRDALAKHERANANVALAQMQEAESQLALVDEKLRAPTSSPRSTASSSPAISASCSVRRSNRASCSSRSRRSMPIG